MLEENLGTLMDVEEDGPEEVEVKLRMVSDVATLSTLMSADQPPLRRERSDNVCQVMYGFGDASGSAFGTTLGQETEVFYEYGQWCTEESEQSSNWRELKNLVDALEGWIQIHSLSGSQLFLFTDNAIAEAAYWKGTQKSTTVRLSPKTTVLILVVISGPARDTCQWKEDEKSGYEWIV